MAAYGGGQTYAPSHQSHIRGVPNGVPADARGGGLAPSPKPMNYGYGSSPLPSQYSARSGSSSSSGSKGIKSPPSSVGMGLTNGTRPIMAAAPTLPSGGGQHVSSANYATAPQRHTQPPRQSNVHSAAQTKGTLKPGQEVTVGSRTVIVDRYLSEGGYAHVYLTHSREPIGPRKLTTHCLKRIAFQEEQAPDMLKDVKREIEVMKTLSRARGPVGKDGKTEEGCRWIVEYLDSSVNRSSTGGWEVFILMEFCAGGGIIDLLNKRLRDRLKEVEILNIFIDVCEAVAFMHHLPQPLLHRDLKIENILSHPRPTGSLPSSFPTAPTTATADLVFKLCDFGSTTFPATTPPRTKQEAMALAYDLNRHTTLQYRSPEMVEPLLGLPVGLPADVWALGVLLYKLCYYTTPFEEHGPLAIVNAKYTFPSFPVYSPPLQHLIASMLVEQPTRRPTVFQVLQRANELRGTKPERDYSRLTTQVSRTGQMASLTPSSSTNLLDFTDSSRRNDLRSYQSMQAQLAASVAPQRRGRPVKDNPMPATGPLPAQVAAVDLQPRPPSANAKPDLLASLDEANTVPAPRIQVTGGAKPETQIKPSKSPLEAPHSDGFGDAFRPPSSFGKDLPLAPTKGFSDSFDGTGFTVDRKPSGAAEKPPVSSVSGFGGGFGDSFVPPSTKLPESASRPTSAAPPIASSPPVIGEMSFEDRFPSLEALMAASGTAYAGSPTSSADLLSPSNAGAITTSKAAPSRQPYEREYSKPHISLTGGKENTHQSADIGQDNQPLPKSTHVTGTAFRRVEDYERPFMRPNLTPRHSTSSITLPEPSKAVDDSAANRAPSWRPANLLDGEKRRPQSLQVPGSMAERFKELGEASSSASAPNSKAVIADLLTGEELPSPDLDMRSLIQPMSATSGGFKTRTQVPPPVSAKPKSLSVATGAKAAVSAPSGLTARPDMSRQSSTLLSDNWSPLESARAALAGDRTAMDGQATRTEEVEKRTVGEQLSSTLPEDAPVRTASKSPSPSRHKVPTSPKIMQRMSYFEHESDKSQSPPKSAQEQDERGRLGLSATKSSARKMPQPVARRSSINAIVSRFEAMSSPQDEGMAGYLESRMAKSPETSPVRSTRNAKPAVAPKPPQHRQPSISERRESTEPERQAPVTAPQPAVPSVATPSAIATPSAPLARQSSHDRPHPNPSPGESPEEPKSVHSLIARWNRGGPPVAGVTPQALKAKSALGQGRKL